MQMFYGVLIGLAFAAVAAVLIMIVESRFIGKVSEKTDSFSHAARADVQAFQEGMTKAVQDHAKKVMDIVVDVKKDVEIMKTRVGGAFSLPKGAVVAPEEKPAGLRVVDGGKGSDGVGV